MKTTQKLCICLLALASFVSSFPLYAATMTATVNKTRLVKNEVFQLKITLDEKVSSDAIDFSVLETDFFLGRPHFGSSLNIINGDRSNRSEWNLTLAPQRLGVLSIPAFTIDGATTTPIKLDVSMDAEEPKAEDLVELQSHLEKSTLYPNEFSLLQTRLIIKSNPRQLQNPQITPPTALGLDIKAIGEPNQYQKVVDGVQVTIIDQDYKVTASEVGQFQLLSIGFKGSAVYGNNRTGTTRLVSVDTAAKPFPITVEALPETSQQSSLPAAQLTLNQQWLDSDGNTLHGPALTTQTGESLTRIIELDIKGLAIEYFPDLDIGYPNALRLYQEKPTFTQLNSSTTRMTIKQVLIAQQPATVSLPEITVNWWDTVNKHPTTSTLKGLELTIEHNPYSQSELIPLKTESEPSVKTITVVDRGVWPYLTALFAALWIATLATCWRLRKNKLSINEDPESESTTEAQLISALSQGNITQASFLLTAWLDENPRLNHDTKLMIINELKSINRSRYAQDQQAWSAENLIRLIKNAHRNGQKNDTEESKLPSL